MEATVSPVTGTTSPTQATLSGDRPMRPVLWWAGFGIFFGAVGLFSVISWMLSADFTPTRPGVTPVPGYMVWANNIQQVGEVVGTVLVMWLVVIRPWRRNGHISLDGTIVLAATAMYWIDPLANYFGPAVSYNSQMLNWGSWSSHIPGWVSEKGSSMPEPPLYAGLWYPIGIILAAMFINYVMRRAKRRWPKLGTSGLALIAIAAGMFFDLALETAYVRLGQYVYPGAYRPLTLFYGNYYQFPLLVSGFTGTALGLIACLRYFVNDKGQTFVEGGIADLRAGPWQRHLVRFFAIYGFLILVGLFAQSQYWWSSQHQAPWPKDILERSYFMNGLCGTDTDIACPGGVVPVTQRGTAHLSPDQKVVVPSGKNLPQPVPFLTK